MRHYLVVRYLDERGTMTWGPMDTSERRDAVVVGVMADGDAALLISLGVDREGTIVYHETTDNTGPGQDRDETDDEGEECDECGAFIDYDAMNRSIDNPLHERHCSLYHD